MRKDSAPPGEPWGVLTGQDPPGSTGAEEHSGRDQHRLIGPRWSDCTLPHCVFLLTYTLRTRVLIPVDG